MNVSKIELGKLFEVLIQKKLDQKSRAFPYPINLIFSLEFIFEQFENDPNLEIPLESILPEVFLAECQRPEILKNMINRKYLKRSIGTINLHNYTHLWFHELYMYIRTSEQPIELVKALLEMIKRILYKDDNSDTNLMILWLGVNSLVNLCL